MKMDRIEPKWIEVDQMDRINLRGPNCSPKKLNNF